MACRRHRPFLVRLIGLAVLGAGLIACGRKGPVRPPELVVPAPITALGASNDAQAINLSWPRPAAYADGTRMTDLGRFIVLRAGGDETAFRPIATLEVGDRDRFRQVKRFQYADRHVSAGQSYAYRVVSVTLDGYESSPSNTVEIVRSVAPATVAPRQPADLQDTRP